MKILFVVNNAYVTGNGLSASAVRTMDYLRRAGAEVRVLSGRSPGTGGQQPDYCLGPYHVPVFDGLIHSQGYSFARADEALIRQAVAWADVVHLEEPFPLQIRTRKIAEALGKPCTATYHLHPENLFASVRLDGWKLLNHSVLRLWRDLVFDRCVFVQCPTRNVQERLERFHFKAPLRLISNGMIPREPAIPAERGEAPYVLLCAGRFSYEKDQMTLLRAMRACAHAGEIQLIFAGRGPLEKKYKREAARLVDEGVLRYAPQFRFLSFSELMAQAAAADLYIHCARVEVEGLSCLEALQNGLVPIIAQGELTATSQFALDAESLFPAGDAKALARRIDWWLERGELRRKRSADYAAVAEEYDIRRSVTQLLELFRDANGQ